MPWTAHMHNGMWRLDIDLNGFWGDAVHLGTHHENLPGTTATDSDPLIATEGGRQWDDMAFNSANVHDATLQNRRGHPTSYHLIPIRAGSGRHDEAFTKNDFWVTRYNWTEMRPKSLPSYISPAQSVSSSDIVLWYWGSVHHLPRDEDGEVVNNYYLQGEAHVMWTGFMLKPHNLFDRTPLFP
jgi:Cu2+-containing amine oxidase